MKLVPVLLEAVSDAIGEHPPAVSRNPALLTRAIRESHRVYGNPPMTVGVDVYNVEAEAWGMEVRSPHPEAVPVLGRPLFSSASELTALTPLSVTASGRLPMLLETAQFLAKEEPTLPFRIGLCGPYALASALVGFENLIMDMADDEEAVTGALMHLARHQANLCHAFQQLGFAVTFYESGAAPPLISPDLYTRVIFPAHGTLFHACRDLVHPPAFVLGGDTAPIAEGLFTLGATSLICPAETNVDAYMGVAMDHPGQKVRINLPGNLVQSAPLADVENRIRTLHGSWGHRPHTVLGTGVLPCGTDSSRIRQLMAYADGP